MKVQGMKRKFWGIVLAAACLLSTICVPEQAMAAVSQPADLKDHYAYAVIDAHTGELLLGDNEEVQVYPASTAKLMTALVLVENGQMDQEIKITGDMLSQVPAGISKYGLQSGQKYTLETLLNMTLISSAGDAAVCAAIAVFGSVPACVDAMNAKAKELGLSGTHFDNPVGLDIGDNFNDIYSTAYDVAMLTRYAMASKEIAAIVKKTSYTVKQTDGTTGRTISSTNSFYSTEEYSKNLYTIIGSKTGTTNAAGYVFSATAVDKKGREVICTYMGRKSKSQTFADIRQLLDAVYKAQKSRDVVLSTGKKVIRTEIGAEYETSYEKGKKISIGAYLIDSKSKAKLSDPDDTFTYKSMDKSVATVNKNGTVTIKGTGTVVIVIKSKKTPYYAATEKTIEIHVTEAAE